VTLQDAQEIPDVPVELCHGADRILHFLDPRVIDGAYGAKLKLSTHFLDPHVVRVGYFSTLVDDVHAMIELVPDTGGVIESFDNIVELFRDGRVFDLQLGKPLDQVEARPGCIQSTNTTAAEVSLLSMSNIRT
jgi:hypothetical protein